MEQKPLSMTVANMVSRSASARRRVAEYLRVAEAMLNDSDSLNRIKAQNCVSCYYSAGRIGGSAITTRPCMCCGLTETYASTSTDALCLVCADLNHLCKHCGGDLDMREDRKDWPSAKPVIED